MPITKRSLVDDLDSGLCNVVMTDNRETVASIMLMERARISAILESPEGLANPKAARELALRQNIESETAIELLRTVGASVDNSFSAAFESAMKQHGVVGIAPIGEGSQAVGGDPKAQRLAELKTVGRAVGARYGFIDPVRR